MNPEQQRSEIAKRLPNLIQRQRGKWYWFNSTGGGGGGVWVACINNDPLNDLNFTHEAEKTLDSLGKDGSYEYWLREVCRVPERESPKGRFFYRATASQRIEALLKALGPKATND